MTTWRRCTRFLRQQFHQMLVRRKRAERVLKHPHLYPALRQSQSLRQCVPLARTFRCSTDSLSVLPRKYRSYRCYVRACRAELRRTRWQTAPSCITPTPTRITKLSGRVLQWGWLGLREGILNDNSTSSFLDTRNEFSITPKVLNLT